MKFLKEGSLYAAGNIASAAVPFLLLPFLTRVMGPTEYGNVVAFAMLVTLCLTVAGLNAHAALGVIWFRRPKNEIPAYTGTALALAIASTVAVSCLITLVIDLFPTGSITPFWGALAALTAGSTVVLQARLVLWQSQHKAFRNVLLQVANSVLNVSLSLGGVLLLGLGSRGRNGGIALAGLLMALVSVFLLVSSREVRWEPEKKQFKTLMTFGGPLILHSLGGVLIASSDRWMVSLRLGSESLGIYGAGAQLGMVMAILADAFVKAYGPWMYSKLSSKDPGDHRCAVGAILAAIPAFIVAALVVGFSLFFLSGLLLGPKYQAATNILPWFMAGGAMNGVYLCTSGLYFFSGRTGLLASVTLSSALFGVGCLWLLVGRFGVTGAAIGYASTQGFLALGTTVVAMLAFDLPWRAPRMALHAWYKNLIR